jgi:hypothetical protein
MSVLGRERPAAISIEIRSIDDTSNFDEFPESDILKPTGNSTCTASAALESHYSPYPNLGDVASQGRGCGEDRQSFWVLGSISPGLSSGEALLNSVEYKLHVELGR